jgi:TolB-like protein
MAEGGGARQSSGGAPAVFISYASQDVAVADAVVTVLEASAIKCWVAPRDVVPGEFYAGAIVHAIDAARAIVLVLSKNAADSQHVLREVERASSKRRPVVSFRIDREPVPADLEYFLNTSQWLDASATGAGSALPKLVDAVRHAVTAATAEPVQHGGGPAESAAAPAQSLLTRAMRRPGRAGAVIAAFVAAAVAVTVVDKLWPSRRVSAEQPRAAIASATPAIAENSVAVLPFVDMSEKHDQQYFADGMAQEVLDLLTRIPGMNAIGHTSSFQFKTPNEDLRSVGARLNVAYVLEGSVRKSATQIRVTAQLIEAASGRRLWSDSYDRNFGDVLVLQTQIANGIARALQLAVATGDAGLLRRMKNPEAYTLYVRGRSAYDRGADDDFRKAEADFEQALVLEPTFSRAAEGLVLTRLGLLGSGLSTSEAVWPRAMEAAHLALRLDPKSSLAHVIIGLKLATYDFDWAGAARELDAASATNPRDPVVLYNCAWLAFDLDRTEDALRYQEASLSLDPLNPDALQNGAVIEYLLGNLAAAERGFRQSLVVSPGYGGNHRWLGRILLLRGRPKEALSEMQAETLSPLRDGGLALAYDALGRKTEADAALARVIQANGGVHATEIAEVYAHRRDLDRGFAWLERAIAVHDLSLGHKLTHDPFLAPLRADPRYKALLRKVRRT